MAKKKTRARPKAKSPEAIEDESLELCDQIDPNLPDEESVASLAKFLDPLPHDNCVYARGFLAWVRGDYEHAVGLLTEVVRQRCETGPRLRVEEFLASCLEPFDGREASARLWKQLGDLVTAKRPMWAAGPALLAQFQLAQLEQSFFDAAKERVANSEATRLLKHALQLDREFWWAADVLGDIYELEGTLDQARHYREQALEYNAVPMMYVRLGRTCRLMGDHAGEKDAYRCCLQECEELDTPVNSDALYCDWMHPFFADGSPVWDIFADLFEAKWSDCAASCVLRGFVSRAEQRLEEAMHLFGRAVHLDDSFWLAAQELAYCYFDAANWRAAIPFFQRALTHCSVQVEMVACLVCLGLCYARAGRRDEAVNAYQRVIEQAPDIEHIRNHLGVELMRLKRHEEAADIFREAMELGTDGKYPLRNLVRALRKMGKLGEAMGLAKTDVYRGKLTKFAERQIEEMQGEKEARSDSPPEDEDFDELEELVSDDDVEEATEEEAPSQAVNTASRRKVKASGRGTRKPRFRVHKEETLEGLIEQTILRTGRVFGRNLRMYGDQDDIVPYGRQYATGEAGIIDLLAEDLDSGDLVVIELKRDGSGVDVVDQIQRYVEWVNAKLAKRAQAVHGIVCARQITPGVKRAVAKLPGIEAFEFELSFRAVK